MSCFTRTKPSVSASQRWDSQTLMVSIFIIVFSITMFCNLWPRQHIQSLDIICIIGLQRSDCSHTSLTKMAQKPSREHYTQIQENTEQTYQHPVCVNAKNSAMSYDTIHATKNTQGFEFILKMKIYSEERNIQWLTLTSQQL